MSLTDLPISFWGHALLTAAYTLNRAPSKYVETTPFELWYGKKPIVSHLKIWGCEAYVKCLQPSKLDPKADKCYFVGYPNDTIGYSFYLPSEHKVFVARNGVFLEKEFLAQEVSGRTVQLNEISESSATVDMAKEPEEIPLIIPTTEPEVVACDAETSDKFVFEPHRLGRTIEPPEWFHNKIFILEDDESAQYKEAMA